LGGGRFDDKRKSNSGGEGEEKKEEGSKSDLKEKGEQAYFEGCFREGRGVLKKRPHNWGESRNQSTEISL